MIATIVITSIIVEWGSGYGSGWTNNGYRNQEYWTATQQACRMLDGARHTIGVYHAEANALRAADVEDALRARVGVKDR